MIFQALKFIKNILLIPIADKYKVELNTSINKNNVAAAKIIALTFLLLEIVMIAVSIVAKGKKIFVQPELNYFYMYILLVAMMLGFFLVFMKLEKNVAENGNDIFVFGTLFTAFLLCWCAAISLMDQKFYGQIIVYVTAIISIAVVPLLQPVVFLSIYVLVQSVFIFLMPRFQSSADIVFGNVVNSTLFILLALVISRMRYKNWIRNFENKKIIQEKSDELGKANEELMEANQQLEILSQRDSLTNIFNRSMFDKMMKIEWDRCQRHQAPLSLIMIDIDFFKTLNDNYGHQIGDFCLKQVAGVLASCVNRSADIVSRYGGDEFAIILPQINIENALKLGKRLRTKVAELSIPQIDSSDFQCITISIGVNTIIPSKDLSIDEFIGKADMALYKAKKERNSIVVLAMDD